MHEVAIKAALKNFVKSTKNSNVQAKLPRHVILLKKVSWEMAL